MNIGDKQAIATKLAERLLGQCVEGIPEEYENDSDICEMLDELVFECNCCGWWNEASDIQFSKMTDEAICGECYADGE